MWEKDIDSFLSQLNEAEEKETEETIKRIEKNVEKLLRGGSKMLKDFVYSKKNNDVSDMEEESDEGDSDNEK